MAAMQLYAKLCVVLNGELLLEQCAVNIYDHVNRPCQVTVTSALPDRGPEVDARTRLGERVKLSVHVLGRDRKPGLELLTIEGPIIEALTSQPDAEGSAAETTFVVENRPEAA